MRRLHMLALAKRGGRTRGAQLAGDTAWGASLFHRRGWLAMTRSYPTLVKAWRENGWRKRWGYPLLDVPQVPPRRKPSSVTVQRGRETSR